MACQEIHRFFVDLSLAQYVDIFWDSDFVEQLNSKCVKEYNFVTSPWVPQKAGSKVLTRNQSCHHPLPIQLPWLPLFIKNESVITIERPSERTVQVVVAATIIGIPWVEPTVTNVWDVTQVSDSRCECVIGIKFQYKQSSWLQSAVESNSLNETRAYFRTWEENVPESRRKYLASFPRPRLETLSSLFPELQTGVQSPTPSNPSPSPLSTSTPSSTRKGESSPSPRQSQEIPISHEVIDNGQQRNAQQSTNSSKSRHSSRPPRPPSPAPSSGSVPAPPSPALSSPPERVVTAQRPAPSPAKQHDIDRLLQGAMTFADALRPFLNLQTWTDEQLMKLSLFFLSLALRWIDLPETFFGWGFRLLKRVLALYCIVTLVGALWEILLHYKVIELKDINSVANPSSSQKQSTPPKPVREARPENGKGPVPEAMRRSMKRTISNSSTSSMNSARSRGSADSNADHQQRVASALEASTDEHEPVWHLPQSVVQPVPRSVDVGGIASARDRSPPVTQAVGASSVRTADDSQRVNPPARPSVAPVRVPADTSGSGSRSSGGSALSSSQQISSGTGTTTASGSGVRFNRNETAEPASPFACIASIFDSKYYSA